MDSDGSSGDDVSTTAADEVPLIADPELPQPTASPLTGPTENDVAFLRQFTRVFSRLLSSGGPNTDTGRDAISFDIRGGDGGGDADAGADDDDYDDDDAYDGFGFSFGAVPASGVAMACLPETTVGEGDGEAREIGGECAVCLEKYEAGDELRTMPCAHGFHERCIFEWLRASRLCPLCRFALPAEEGAEADDVEDRTYDCEDDEGEVDDDGALEYLRWFMFGT